MLLLQADTVVSIGLGSVAALLGANTFMLARLGYQAGKVVQQVESQGARLLLLEGKACPHADCPIRAHLDLSIEKTDQ